MTRAAPFWERLAWLRILSTHHFLLIKLKKWHKSLNLPSRLGFASWLKSIEVLKRWKMDHIFVFCGHSLSKTFEIDPKRLRNEPYRPSHFGQNTENGRIFFNSVKRRWKYIKFSLRIAKNLILTSDPPPPIPLSGLNSRDSHFFKLNL